MEGSSFVAPFVSADTVGSGRGAGHDRPWNLMIKHRYVQRRGRRSHTTVRSVLFSAACVYVLQFFEKAAENVKENVGDDVQPDLLIREAYRNVLEHAKQLFPEGEGKKAGPTGKNRLRARPIDEEYSHRGSPLPKKVTCGTGVFIDLIDSSVLVLNLNDLFQWDPSRLTDGSTFVLGSRANKALGMGGTRGRIYIKHADLFKYAADSKDKQWLAERHHMRATGGKMLIAGEMCVVAVVTCIPFRDCPDVRMDELKPFSVPPWMVEKMQRAMEAQRDSDP
uniref:Deoxynucleotidyltransferase terminal-interacting protein 1 n=1 Tax=Nothobranchius furzeri TaxID=105023 RepID=A0A8C6L8T1_NOTFU